MSVKKEGDAPGTTETVPKSNSKTERPSEFSYLPPPEPFYVQQGLREKLVSKTKENPFVPLGVVFTTVVLAWGLSSLRSSDGRKAQLLMRARVGGQAFAVFAMLAGVYYNTKKEKNG